ncbi:hypothetical protein CH254_24005 [Rhodococcus sp. 06-412-2C]|nr:hypothetical protein CH254_24005 [Rhodococcus sp. 06-412-2C]OZC94139.1 hypothetical protein CH279_22090 [Rhodococcus sp. 06-412-2B]
MCRRHHPPPEKATTDRIDHERLETNSANVRLQVASANHAAGAAGSVHALLTVDRQKRDAVGLDHCTGWSLRDGVH